jgi:hypothetical protein
LGLWCSTDYNRGWGYGVQLIIIGVGAMVFN